MGMDEVNKMKKKLKNTINKFRGDRCEKKGVLVTDFQNRTHQYVSEEEIESRMMESFKESLKDALKDYPDLYEEFIKAVDKSGDLIDSLNSLEGYYKGFFTNQKFNYYIKKKEESEYHDKKTQILIKD
jgi:hypothetical protein